MRRTSYVDEEQTVWKKISFFLCAASYMAELVCMDGHCSCFFGNPFATQRLLD